MLMAGLAIFGLYLGGYAGGMCFFLPLGTDEYVSHVFLLVFYRINQKNELLSSVDVIGLDWPFLIETEVFFEKMKKKRPRGRIKMNDTCFYLIIL